MPTYTYEAMNSVGQPVKGEIEAASGDDAISLIRKKGQFPTIVKEGSKAKSQKVPKSKSQKVHRLSLISRIIRQLTR